MNVMIINDNDRTPNLEAGDYFTFNYKANTCGMCNIRRIIKNTSGNYMSMNVKTGEVAGKEMDLKDLLRQYSDVKKVKIVGYDSDKDTLFFEIIT